MNSRLNSVFVKIGENFVVPGRCWAHYNDRLQAAGDVTEYEFMISMNLINDVLRDADSVEEFVRKIPQSDHRLNSILSLLRDSAEARLEWILISAKVTSIDEFAISLSGRCRRFQS